MLISIHKPSTNTFYAPQISPSLKLLDKALIHIKHEMREKNPRNCDAQRKCVLLFHYSGDFMNMYDLLYVLYD